MTATVLRASPGVHRGLLLAVGAPVPLVLLVALAVRWSGAVTGAIVLLGAQQAVRLALGNDVLDEWAPLVGGALLLCAELAWWSIEPRIPAWAQSGLALRRLAFVLLICLLGAAVGAVMLVAAGSSLSGGVPLELAGIVAATGVVAVLAYVARRSP
ncbi:MAG TPA: hypothetical protein VLD16_00175 [Gaiellaceae bacterium]|nr:hypothetical protein [Gaiellaceae bacterium]